MFDKIQKFQIAARSFIRIIDIACLFVDQNETLMMRGEVGPASDIPMRMSTTSHP